MVFSKLFRQLYIIPKEFMINSAMLFRPSLPIISNGGLVVCCPASSWPSPPASITAPSSVVRPPPPLLLYTDSLPTAPCSSPKISHRLLLQAIAVVYWLNIACFFAFSYTLKALKRRLYPPVILYASARHYNANPRHFFSFLFSYYPEQHIFPQKCLTISLFQMVCGGGMDPHINGDLAQGFENLVCVR